MEPSVAVVPRTMTTSPTASTSTVVPAAASTGVDASVRTVTSWAAGVCTVELAPSTAAIVPVVPPPRWPPTPPVPGTRPSRGTGRRGSGDVGGRPPYPGANPEPGWPCCCGVGSVAGVLGSVIGSSDHGPLLRGPPVTTVGSRPVRGPWWTWQVAVPAAFVGCVR